MRKTTSRTETLYFRRVDFDLFKKLLGEIAWDRALEGNMHVSLAEALEVRGGPLQEEEIWAILNQSAESLQELFTKADPTALEFIISPWSLLLLPSGSVSFTDENVSQQDLRAFTAPEVLQNHSLSSLSDVEKNHTESQNAMGLEGTSGDHLVQPACQSRSTQSRSHRNMSRSIFILSVWHSFGELTMKFLKVSLSNLEIISTAYFSACVKM
ncbi:tyrosine-protein phosphatase non-receptor type 13 isoform x3 [Limosa lapponica baueri]|uniref:Tyrosine-protein phosphatase non-receptor type 13 isoform x3 n=1 Tax=Limosa lapponica baueri TaxID=1758121 RepID=A0A2I0U6N1_LIMLA|nr:tyrosine-protein phosphatase non-receptor type 13 isoform x3 [Limosa lapponica baueri]